MTALFWHNGIDGTKARDSCLLYWKRTLEFIRSPIKDYELNFAFKVIQQAWILSDKECLTRIYEALGSISSTDSQSG